GGLSDLFGASDLQAGGGLGAEGLGGLGTKGIGSGRSGYGSGVGRLGARGNGAVARVGESLVLGSLDKRVIQAVVKRHLNQIRYCYVRELNRRPDLRGKLTMRFMIGADGYVRQATVKTTSIQNDAVGDCVRGRLLRMRFPERPGGEMVMVSYPFLFSPDGSSDWGPSYDVVRTFPRGMLRTSNGARHDFRSTVHFDPRITTGADGTAEVSFVVSDAVTTFRISAEGVGGGHAGRVEEELHSTRPFALDVVLPTEVSFGDRVLMPVRLRNRTDDRLQVVLDTDLEAPLVAEDGTGNQSFGMPRADGRTTYVPVSVPDVAGEATVRVAAAADGLQDEVVHTVRVAPRGFPHRVTEAGELQRVARHTITIDDALPGSIDARLSLYPNPLSTLMDGMESMVGWPGGCFEQTSSTNYPNVLILRHLERTDRHGALQMDRTEVLRSGYERLVGYQVDSGGFETFGRGPGKEALSAYGLLQFADMRTVFSEVSPAMVERDVRYLLAARDGSGGYRASGASSHQWGAAPASLTNAFITWALLETGHLTDGTEVGLARQRAETESDPYALSLSVLALQHADPAAAEVAAGRLAAMQQADGSFVGAATSVVGSGGRDLLVETTALAVLALNRATGEAAGVRRGASWLASARRGHGWGATQATVLALKALDAVARQSADPHAGWVQVRVDGKAVGTLQWTGTETSGVQLDLASVLPAGTHEVELVAEVPLHEPVPYSLDATWRRDTPLDAPEAPLTLTTEWSATEVSLGSPVRLVARVQNVSDAEVASPIARIGLPAGVRAETRQLEALRAEGTIAFFETRPREVILYWEGFAPDQQTTVRLDLVSEVPGRFAAPPSVVHPYYDSDAKRWTAGAKLTIRPG
nr:AgmX/PglI C-terminal domain-containing protein [Myxococcales bacterium]